MYGGELLPGFYDEWVIIERERLQLVFENRIKGLIDSLLEARRWEEVIEWGERWLALAGAAEAAYRSIMTAYAELGELSKVGHTYQRCVEALRRDLGVEPSEETYNRYRQLSQKGHSQPAVAKIPSRPNQSTDHGNSDVTQPAVPGAITADRNEPLDAEGLSGLEPPFKGLQYFDEADASLFFGREELTARLLERIGFSAGNPQDGDHLLFVIGASGSGKSSLVRAGLVPMVRQRSEAVRADQKNGQMGWQIVILTPAAHPVEMLAVNLTREVKSVTAAATLMDDMRRDPRSLRLYLLKQPASTFIVVDQMEELFTLCRDDAERLAFIDNLMTAVDGGHCKVIFTLRADFYSHCAQFDTLRTALSSRQEYIGPMNAMELRRAIEEPALRCGYSFEPGLVDLILREVGREPGALPLLSHALLETWKHRQGKVLTLAGYAEAGGVHGAIARSAETVYARLNPQQQVIARTIFIRLTELGDGADAVDHATPDTRRRVALAELIPVGDERSCVEEVLNLLSDARLVTMDQETVEVAHEALIREWPALQTWLSQDRDGLRLHRRLTEAAQNWEELEYEPGELVRGVRLAQALEWAAGHPGELNDLERNFLAASQALAEKETSEREAARQRDVEAAQRFAQSEQRRAEEQSRSAQRLRWFSAGLAILLFAAVVLASLAFYQRNQVESQTRLATSRELASSSLSNLDVDPERSILLALQALHVSDTREAENALHKAVQTSRLIKVFKTQYQWATRMAFSPDGQRLATTSLNTDYVFVTEIWDISTGRRLLTLPGGLAA